MKKMKVVALAAGILLLAGCGNEAVDNNSQKGESKEVSTSQEVDTNKKQTKGDMISTIEDAMKSGKAMKCTYKIKEEKGEITAVSYVDGEKYKTEMTVAGIKQNMIFDEKAMYSWSDGQKQGMKMTNECVEELNEDIPEDVEGDISDEAEPTESGTFDGAVDVKCEEAGKVDFSVPADVKFVDQCEMMKNITNNIPAGINIPGGVPELP